MLQSSALLKRRELDVPDPFEESCRQNYDKLSKIIASKNAADVQSLLIKEKNITDVYKGLLYSVLIGHEHSEKSFSCIRAITLDNFTGFSNILFELCEKKFPNLLPGPANKVFSMLDVFLSLEVSAIEPCIICLFRQISLGSSISQTITNTTHLFSLSQKYKSYIVTRPPLLQMTMWHFLRIVPELAPDQQLQIAVASFVSQLILDHPQDWRSLGRDAARIAQTVFGAYPPIKSSLDGLRLSFDRQTPFSFLQSRLTPDMEEKIMFLLHEVPLGGQLRYLGWINSKFVRGAESYLFDLIRYLCCLPRPIKSRGTSLWMILGWFIKTYRQSSFISSLCRVSLLDWIYFRSGDDAGRLECCLLLMLNSTKNYPDITQLLLDTLAGCASSWQPSDERAEVRASIENAFIKSSAAAGVTSLSALFLSPAAKNCLSSLFPKAFSATTPQSQSSAPILKRASTAPPLSHPAKLARKSSSGESQSLLARILKRLPLQLKEPFSNLFLGLSNDAYLDDVDIIVNPAMNASISFLNSTDKAEDFGAVGLSLAELFKSQLCTGTFRASPVLISAFNASRSSPLLLSLLRRHEAQLGFHMLDWTKLDPRNITCYVNSLELEKACVNDDIRACRSACPPHTSTLLLWCYHQLPSELLVDPALFSRLLDSCPPADLCEMSLSLSTGVINCFQLDDLDERVALMIRLCQSMLSLTHHEQSWGWTLLTNVICGWEPGMVIDFTEKIVVIMCSKRGTIAAFDFQGLFSLWGSLQPLIDHVLALCKLPAAVQSVFTVRVITLWFKAHPLSMLSILSNILLDPVQVATVAKCASFFHIFTHRRQANRFFEALTSDRPLLRKLASSGLSGNDSVKEFCQGALNSKSTVPSTDVDNIDMERWTSFAST
uniref:Integrator complex subunit 3 N-terminal domain-containing protein n=1 Tax=Spongospora subterranea TaxID=70186 RepID=A0A0H5QPZ2_9EUKA|eukprot:CRZ03491.1 hypothetical protein [Spongospora subterranea]